MAFFKNRVAVSEPWPDLELFLISNTRKISCTSFSKVTFSLIFN